MGLETQLGGIYYSKISTKIINPLGLNKILRSKPCQFHGKVATEFILPIAY
jgi:hypothetical protein